MEFYLKEKNGHVINIYRYGAYGIWRKIYIKTNFLLFVAKSFIFPLHFYTILISFYFIQFINKTPSIGNSRFKVGSVLQVPIQIIPLRGTKEKEPSPPYRFKIEMACLRITFRDESQIVANSSLLCSSPTILRTYVPTHLPWTMK